MPILTPAKASPAAPAVVRRHTIAVELRDRPGALYRAIGLVRRRGFNVSSLVVGASEEEGTSRMVLVVEATDVDQVVQQLMRLVDVLSVAEIAREGALVRETVLAVIELHDDEPEVLEAARRVEARVTHHGYGRVLIELTTDPLGIDAFVATLRSRFELKQLARTGPIVLRETDAATEHTEPQPVAAATEAASLSPAIPSAQESPR
jgi:acetolactate synthase-1/3 small subunit